MKRPTLFVALTLAAACATAPSTQTSVPRANAAAATTDAMPSAEVADHAAPNTATKADTSAATVLFLLRHAEKADDGTRNPPLLPEGTRRADCLAHVLDDVPVTHLFATELQRTELTLAAVAKAKSLSVTTSHPSKVDELAATLEALPAGSTAVVAGHSNTIPALAARLGTPLSRLNEKGYIPEHEHDRLAQLVTAPRSAGPLLIELRYCAPSKAP